MFTHLTDILQFILKTNKVHKIYEYEVRVQNILRQEEDSSLLLPKTFRKFH